MDASIVSLIINVVLILFVLLGFFWGLGRGLKKSAVRLLYVVIFVIICALITPLVAGALLGITLPQGFAQSIVGDEITLTSGVSIAKALELLLLGTADAPTQLGQMAIDNPTLVDVITKLPAVFLSLVVFVLLVLMAKAISWIGYAITCRIHFKKNKKSKKNGEITEPQYAIVNGKPVIVEQGQSIKEPKKHRLLGGLVGAVQGVVLMFCFFLPITGIVGIAGQFVDTTKTAQAESTATADDGKYPYIKKMVSENIDKEIIEYFSAYQNSIANKILSFSPIDEWCFDVITTQKIGDEKVIIRQEINTVAEVTETVLYIEDLTSQPDMELSGLDFEKLEHAISHLFDSGLIRSVGTDFIMTFLGYAVEDTPNTEIDLDKTIDDGINSTGYGDEIRRLLGAIYDNLENGTVMNTLKSDIMAIVGVGKYVVQSGVVDGIMAIQDDNTIAEEEKADAILEEVLTSLSAKPEDSQKSYLTLALERFFSSTTLQSVIAETVNIGLDEAEKEILNNILKYDAEYINAQTDNAKQLRKAEIQNMLRFDEISQTSVNWTNFANTFADMFQNLIDSYDVYFETKDMSAEEVISHPEFKNAFIAFGKALDCLLNLEIFSDTVGQNNIISQALANFEKFYIDIEDEVFQVGDLLKLTALDVKTNGEFTTFETIFNSMYDLYPVLMPIMDTENVEDIDFSAINYFGATVGGQYQIGLSEALDNILTSPLGNLITTKFFDFVEITAEDNQSVQAIIDEVMPVIYDKNNIQTLAQIKDVLIGDNYSGLLNISFLLAETGMVDLIIETANQEPSQDPGQQLGGDIQKTSGQIANEIYAKLTEIKSGREHKQIDLITNAILETDVAKQLIISAINNILTLEDYPDAKLMLAYSDDFTTEIEQTQKITANLLAIYKNLDIKDTDDLEVKFAKESVISAILNANFINTDAQTPGGKSTANALAEILATLHTSRVLNLDATPNDLTDNQTANLVEELFKKLNKDNDMLYLDDLIACPDNQLAIFYKNEINNIGNILVILNNTPYGDGTALDSMAGEYLDAFALLSDNDLDKVLDCFMNSSLLTNIRVDLVNSINAKLIHLIDAEAEVADACTKDTNLLAQNQTFKAVIKSALKCKDITDFELALKGDDKQNVKALLDALSANANYASGQQGVFYDAYENYFKPYHALITSLDSEVFDGTVTLLDAVLNGQDISDKALEVNNEKLGNIISALIDCELLKAYTVKIFNDLNIRLVTLIDPDYNAEVCTQDTDFAVQKESLLAVITATQHCKDITDIQNMSSLQNSYFEFLKNALKANSDEFGTGAVFYDAHTNYFADL